MAEFLKIDKADELSPGQARRVKVRGKRFALFNIDGNFSALEDICIHKGEPLSVRTIAGDMPVARREVQHPNRRGARAFRAPRHRSFQRSANGDRYRDSGVAKAVECGQAEG
jgi:Rieske [2Fe-2S] domain